MDVKEVNISKVKPNDYNPNKLTPTEYRNVRYSIEKYGLVIPIFVRESGDSYIIIDGEQRYRIAKELNYKKIWVVIDHGKEDSERYKQLTIIMDEFRGNLDRDIVEKILSKDSEDTVELLKRMKFDMGNDYKFKEPDFIREAPDWEDKDLFQTDENYKDQKIPYTITATKGEIETLRDYEKITEQMDMTTLGSIWEFVSKRELNEDEKFFLHYMLALRRAFVHTHMPFRNNPEKPVSIIYRGNMENIEKIVNFIDLLRKKENK